MEISGKKDHSACLDSLADNILALMDSMCLLLA